MSRTAGTSQVADAKAAKLPGLPRGRLSSKERLEALRRVQKEAEQRVTLGMQLYRAAEQHTVHHEALVADVKADQARLKVQLQDDIARSLQACDQWVGKIDEDFTSALKGLEQRIDNLQNQWSQSQQRINNMMRRSEAFLDQSREMVSSIADVASASHPSPPPSPSVDTPPAPPPQVEVPQVPDASTEVPATALGNGLPIDEPPYAPAPGPSAESPPNPDERNGGLSAPRLYQSVMERLTRAERHQGKGQDQSESGDEAT